MRRAQHAGAYWARNLPPWRYGDGCGTVQLILGFTPT